MPKNSVDADAQAFLTAAAITDPTISGAINTLVVQMKADNIWSKMKAVYPMVGGTASTHKFNLKDPRDLDAAFRLQFNGGWTHSANGALPNGTNTYADTNLNQLSILNVNSNHISVYSRTNTNSGSGALFRLECGITNNVTHSFNQIGMRAALNQYSENGSHLINSAVSDSLGHAILTSTASNAGKIYKNGSSIGTSTVTQTRALFNNTIYIGATRNVGSNPGAVYFSQRELAFSSIGDGLSDTEAANFYTAVQNFQTSLGRQV